MLLLVHAREGLFGGHTAIAWGRVMYLARDDYAAPAALRMSSIPAWAPEDSS